MRQHAPAIRALTGSPWPIALICLLLTCWPTGYTADIPTIARDGHWLVVKDPRLPRGELRINFLEAYCRANSTDADWVQHTRMGHTSVLIAAAPDGRRLEVRDTVSDGVLVDHVITTDVDGVDIRTTAHNPGTTPSGLHWAQPCVRLGEFTGLGADVTPDDSAYLPKCFIFLDDRLTRLPTPEWTTTARYVPGQVWRPAHVPASDVNPRPLNPRHPSNGLIGCFNADETLVLALACEPWQELFQGVARCLHADLRIGGLAPGERKQVRSRIYLVPADIPALLARYTRDFPPTAP